jgi:hypothetical protein
MRCAIAQRILIRMVSAKFYFVFSTGNCTSTMVAGSVWLAFTAPLPGLAATRQAESPIPDFLYPFSLDPHPLWSYNSV